MRSRFTAALLFVTFCAQAQFMLTKEQMIAYTKANPYERFEDGRPKVPDALLEKVKGLITEEVFGTLGGKNFPNQFTGDFKILNPGKRLVGRALTVQFMPTRPDVAEAIQAEATKLGIKRRLGNQTPMEMLGPNDVIVVDLFGKTDAGTFVGDKLAYYIWKTTGTGMVVDGGMFWLGKIIPTGMPAYYRGTGPRALSGVMLTGVNIPIRIGSGVVMPGDVVLGRDGGVIFIPPQLAEQVVRSSEITRLRDEFGHARLRAGVYTAGQIDGTWTAPIEADFTQWLRQNIDRLPVARPQIEDILKQR